jgi:hypothetical protein
MTKQHPKNQKADQTLRSDRPYCFNNPLFRGAIMIQVFIPKINMIFAKIKCCFVAPDFHRSIHDGPIN